MTLPTTVSSTSPAAALTEPRDIWQVVLRQLQHEISRTAFDAWVRETQALDWDGTTLRVGVPNAFAQEWLQSRLPALVEPKLQLLLHVPQPRVQFVLLTNGHAKGTLPAAGEEPSAPEPSAAAAAEPIPQEKPTAPLPLPVPNLRPEYTFDTFVEGPNNRLAFAASRAVADNPGRQYNPLFIYGGVGLGKTHLLHAIGHVAAQRGLRVLYVSAEDFVNELITAIRERRTAEFREKYRRVDLLLVDDVQFLSGKESTQEEFFHTFNALHGQGRQIVLTSDRPPKAMPTLEERLRSRFEWGLMADIQPPDLETRLAILQFKVTRLGRAVPREVLEFIARRMTSNIRELEGALTRVLAYHDLWRKPLNEATAAEALADLLPRKRKVVADKVLETVAQAFGLSVAELRAKGRSRRVAVPRQIAMYLLREEAGLSLPRIGELLGGRDHSTVMHGVRKVADRLERDAQFRRRVMNLREHLYNPAVPLLAE